MTVPISHASLLTLTLALLGYGADFTRSVTEPRVTG